ncbi:SRPBCC domain-containing protein [Ciceribacter sp. L1K23]|uniref:SRPBCC family protein n=1 Tax=Ciceribacter sp. L1K23 TaxID=2820276 RepID=UPI001B82A635|nr:SRPBCC domain-containing protein [Ciceribacter sp. L1K23]MBR0554666.1 SRPBCC domain-containing protein [Ciceribacter sp. L1K23]
MTTITAEKKPLYELRITRVFAAARETVFKAWTDPARMAQWGGPADFTVLGDQMDVRPGGRHRACLVAPNGDEHWVSGEYLEVSPPERLVFTHAWELSDGQRSPETVVTVELTEKDGGTLMMFHQAFFESPAGRDGHESGWSEAFERLATLLSTGRDADPS